MPTEDENNTAPTQQPIPPTIENNEPAEEQQRAPEAETKTDTEPEATLALQEPVPAQTLTTKPKSPIRQYLFWVLIGGLIISAAISIVGVLIGSFNEVIGKSLLTTLSLVVHALIGLAVTHHFAQKKTLSAKIIAYALFTVTVLSLFTSVGTIWGNMGLPMQANLYATYLLGLGLSLVAAAITQECVDVRTKRFVKASIVIMAIMYLLTIPVIFADNHYILPDIYIRIIWALVILCVTLIMLTAIFGTLAITKLQKDQPQRKNKPVSIGRTIIFLAMVLLGWPLTLPIIFMFIAAFN